nr:DUF1905 domain-containing protein [Tessaracoccus coleopterorum]
MARSGALPLRAAQRGGRGVVADSAALLTYGWGCIPVQVRIGATDFTTSLFPRDGGYLLPVKVVVQRAEGLGIGDRVHARLHLEPRL